MMPSLTVYESLCLLSSPSSPHVQPLGMLPLLSAVAEGWRRRGRREKGRAVAAKLLAAAAGETLLRPSSWPQLPLAQLTAMRRSQPLPTAVPSHLLLPLRRTKKEMPLAAQSQRQS